ncbi:MAG TPA: sulfatase-like hydrolase/transferase [Acidimicrobiales bacterium]|nr:sulfatase-like hydrolase/transferase [Acidimicrobiales bacterium]
MRATLRREGRALAELLALTGVAVTQPVLDVFSNSADVFVHHRAGALDVVGFVVAVTFVPALALWGVEWLIGRLGDRPRAIAHTAFVAALAGIAAVVLVGDLTSWPAALIVVTALAVAVAVGIAVRRVEAVRLWLRYLALAPVALAALFLFASPVTPVAFSGSVGTAAAARVDDPAPVVMVVLDELPTASLLGAGGRIDADLFPGFAELASLSTFYRNHSTVSASSPQAVPAILTGRLPSAATVAPVATEHPENLFTLLGARYDLHVAERVTDLCPSDLCPDDGAPRDAALPALIGDAVDVWTDLASPTRTDGGVEFVPPQSDPGAPARFGRWIDRVEVATDGRPTLHFAHVVLPHQPWWHLPSGHRYQAPVVAPGLDRNYRWIDQEHADAARVRHLLQLQRADGLIADLLDRLRAQDALDDALVVVTADHGVAFTADAPIRGVSRATLSETLWSPLFVKAPGATTGTVDDRPVLSIDVLPTIADLLGIDLPWAVDGVPAHDRPTDPPVDERPMGRWSFNELNPPPGVATIPIDGTEAFADLLDRAVRPAPGPAGDDLRVHRLGPRGDLVGRPVTDIDPDADKRDPAPGWSVRLDDPDRFRDVDPDDEIVPVWVEATLEGPVAATSPTPGPTPPVALAAVSIDGTIGGVGPLLAGDDPDTWHLAVLVPESLVHAGDLDVGVHLVAGDGAAPTLTRVAP